MVSRNVAIRNELDLYVNVLHCKSYPGVPARQSNIDVVIIRQNTEGEYAMLEHEVRWPYLIWFLLNRNIEVCYFVNVNQMSKTSK